MTHAHEAVGQYVDQEAADEFLRIKSQGLASIPVSPIPAGESDLTVVDREDTVIGVGDPVGVAAEVIRLW